VIKNAKEKNNKNSIKIKKVLIKWKNNSGETQI